MNRLPRGIHGSGFFHVMVQGINKEYIFDKNGYKDMYFLLMTEFRKKFNLLLICYCIMDNHAHLIIYTDDVTQMSNYMQKINCTFAKFYNKEMGRVGYVFRDRYNSQYINNHEYLLQCINYIHMNPVKANIVETPNKYKYSSYNDYIKKKNIINDEIINKVFGVRENYLDIFLGISNKEIEVMDIEREEKNFEIAVNRFLEEYELSLDNIKTDKNNLKGFCRAVIMEKGYRQNKVAKLLKISKGKISKIINEMETKKSV